jgi:hypothetical protein
MSTYWDVHCLDCNVESGLHLNHGDDTCRDLIEFRDAIAMIADIQAKMAKSWTEISISVPGERGHIDQDFYKTHAGHALAAVNEYGQIDGDCNERGPAFDYVPCPLPEGHEGDHDFEKRPWEEVLRRAAERRR